MTPKPDQTPQDAIKTRAVVRLTVFNAFQRDRREASPDLARVVAAQSQPVTSSYNRDTRRPKRQQVP
jgi:hypothetical protein